MRVLYSARPQMVSPSALRSDSDLLVALRIIAATPEGDSEQCPTLGDLVPYFSGEHGTDDDNPYHEAREDNSSHAPVFDP